MRRIAMALPWIAWAIAIAVFVHACPGASELGELKPLTRGQQIAMLGALAGVAAAHTFSGIYAFVDTHLPADGWRPISGDVFAWFRPWFVLVRGHGTVVASWRAACGILRTRLAALGFVEERAVAEVGRYTATTLLGHADRATFAAVTLTIDRAPRLELAFVSLLDDGTLLVTASVVEKRGPITAHEALPIAPRGRVQVLDDGAPPGSLLGEHERTIAWLGRAEQRAGIDELAAALATASADRRRAFLARPVRNMLRAWWRAAHRRRPDRGALRSRPSS